MFSLDITYEISPFPVQHDPSDQTIPLDSKEHLPATPGVEEATQQGREQKSARNLYVVHWLSQCTTCP